MGHLLGDNREAVRQNVAMNVPRFLYHEARFVLLDSSGGLFLCLYIVPQTLSLLDERRPPFIFLELQSSHLGRRNRPYTQ